MEISREGLTITETYQITANQKRIYTNEFNDESDLLNYLNELEESIIQEEIQLDEEIQNLTSKKDKLKTKKNKIKLLK